MGWVRTWSSQFLLMMWTVWILNWQFVQHMVSFNHDKKNAIPQTDINCQKISGCCCYRTASIRKNHAGQGSFPQETLRPFGRPGYPRIRAERPSGFSRTVCPRSHPWWNPTRTRDLFLFTRHPGRGKNSGLVYPHRIAQLPVIGTDHSITGRTGGAALSPPLVLARTCRLKECFWQLWRPFVSRRLSKNIRRWSRPKRPLCQLRPHLHRPGHPPS